MDNMIAEIALRLLKAAAAGILRLVLYLVLISLGTAGSVELALLCWLSGAAFVVLVETSPI